MITNGQLYVLTILAHFADGFTTVIRLKGGGREANPLVQVILEQFGLMSVFAWKIGLLLLIYIIWQYTPVTETPFPTHRVVLVIAFFGGLIPTLWNLIPLLMT